MHVGIVSKKLVFEELRDKVIYIPHKDRVIFPEPGTPFSLSFYEESYNVFMTKTGFIEGLDLWFDSLPLKKGDITIIAKHATGYFLTTTSEVVKSQLSLILEMRKIEQLSDRDIICPNCYHSLEEVTLPADSRHDFKLRCARCGFILVRTIIGGFSS